MKAKNIYSYSNQLMESVAAVQENSSLNRTLYNKASKAEVCYATMYSSIAAGYKIFFKHILVLLFSLLSLGLVSVAQPFWSEVRGRSLATAICPSFVPG